MVENPDKFKEKNAEGEANLSASEIRKIRRKANKAKAVQEKEKQHIDQVQGTKQQTVGSSQLFINSSYSGEKTYRRGIGCG